jgi:ABC-type multidrug transport system permease subunit
MKKSINKLYLILALIPWLLLPVNAYATDYLATFTQKIFTDAEQTYVSALLLLIIAAAVAAFFRAWSFVLISLAGAFVAGILLFNSTDIASWFPT